MKQILIILVFILVSLTQIILAHTIDNGTLPTSFTLSVESINDTVTIDSTLTSQSVNDTSTIDYEYNQAREIFGKPSPSRNFSVLPLIMIGGALIGLGGVLVGMTILIRKNESTKSAVSTQICLEIS
ncbi:unnamed protein product [Rotaria socialis]|uniref:Uncharacterized protein n=1 Tax=Rotaria socialis TaxID=392032 RepID=A0A817UM01_9BILA|nr:unnamed protein product [Rotaria socialis]CAF3263656.1 unnamed protein product [Rotaria socialis]CAF3332817.1 unnamed protein product [Rotaria socialis]CAF3333138.1 unnamed protein product [Rotaria socialis]CAF3494596.1 unnamed protein product [Rotaria socialis]